ncbi:NADH-quinone oxidoreductase subunit C [Streptomyces sp. NPDC023998]|uniref:NADH-quinone oxidoreductase subunit C n=1 Tax=Streptomyces sp. NPDC023998 TaxID=3154597 RepID=UPI0033E1A47A
MSSYDRLPDAVTEIFGEEATAERAYELLTVDVPVGSWIAALEIARDKLGCTYFDWLSAVDEPGTGFRICAHVVAVGGGTVRRLLLRTTVPHTAPSLPSAVEIYAGAAWHERETHEMFGVEFPGHPHLVPLLLPEGFEGHPLRKDFVLAARVAKAWPGAKEPGESEHGGPKRRQMLPPGVPDPNEWGPLKGQLPPAPARPARTPRTPRAAGATADRPPRRTRTAGEHSAGQAAEPAETAETGGTGAPAAGPRRTRTASEGSAGQDAAPGTTPPRRARSASEGSAMQREEPTPAPDAAQTQPAGPAAPEPTAGPAAPKPEAQPPAQPPAVEASKKAATAAESEAEGPTDAPETSAPPLRARSADAPWHHARPAFDDSATGAETGTETGTDTGAETGTDEDAGGDARNEADSDTPPTTLRPKSGSGSAEGPDDEPTDTAGGDPA